MQLSFYCINHWYRNSYFIKYDIIYAKRVILTLQTGYEPAMHCLYPWLLHSDQLWKNQYDIGRRGGAENACVKVICIDGFVLLAQL